MMHSLKRLEGYVVGATDGESGAVVDVLFDEETWATRYVVVDIGDLVHSRAVLVPRVSFREVDPATRRFHVDLTVEAVTGCPLLSAHEPVSRRLEHDLDIDRDSWLDGVAVPVVPPQGAPEADAPFEVERTDAQLWSAGDVRGYRIEGTNGAIGHVVDFLADDEAWMVRYLVVDTSNWWLGRRVIIPPHWTRSIGWSERRIHVDLTREEIRRSPVWNANEVVNRTRA